MAGDLWNRLRDWARSMRRDVVAVWLATRDPRTPVFAKAVAMAVVVYALSPIDLIPDFVPVLGYLDDVVIVPLGILLAVRLIPAALMAEFRAAAAQRRERPSSAVGFAFILTLWLVTAALLLWWVWPRIAP